MPYPVSNLTVTYFFLFLRKYTADVPNPIIPNPASRIQNITGVSSPVFGASVDIVPDGVSVVSGVSEGVSVGVSVGVYVGLASSFITTF